ncbi:sensor histidine kinase [Promicromonospora sukumoe]|uniref:sensor histidine kinase n=1 Tax=Promicromonospora sukumoe TaxID=88382 RepID=UPI000362AFE7|nr:histidine kinase [Promicromonospora sukumoe]
MISPQHPVPVSPSAPDDAAPTRAVVGWLVVAGLWLYYLAPVLVRLPQVPWPLLALAVGSGAVGVATVALHHRHPLVAVVVSGATLLVSPAALGAVIYCQASLARRGARRVATAAGAGVVAAKLAGLLLGADGEPWTAPSTVELTLTVAGTALATLTGWLVTSRTAETRQQSAAALARREADEARLEQARMAERERIAREMHDVLAHRLSLVALNAGALAYRTDLDSDTARVTAAQIQSDARQSLADLRTVLGTLRRAPDGPPEPPQPTLHELPVLIAEAEESGQSIDHQITGAESVPQYVSRQAYRIVQEALTNARKHAPGEPVTVQVAHAGHEVRIRVSNPVPATGVPGGRPGYGLVGVAERTAGVDGTARHDVVDGAFVLDATLPVREAR